MLIYDMKSCDVYGNPTYIDESVEIAVSLAEMPAISFTSVNNTASFFSFTVPEYTLQQDLKYNFNVRF